LGNAAHATPLLIPGATTKATLPTIETKAASVVGQTTATLNASVTPNGGEVTECELEYGTTSAYGLTAPCTPSPGSGTSPVAVSASITGLAANTTYHFRVLATNGRTSQGADETLKTLTSPPNPQTVVTLLPALMSETPTVTSQGSVSGFQERRTQPIPNAKLASTFVTASSSGAVRVRVICPAVESSCTGALTLRTLSAGSAAAPQSNKRKAGILTLAAGSFRVAGGRATTVKLHLSGRARMLLSRTRVLRARATVVAHDPAGVTHTTQTIVTIRAAKAAHGH
jgi:hypothetical protein